jgi:hypothetical protein
MLRTSVAIGTTALMLAALCAISFAQETAEAERKEAKSKVRADSDWDTLDATISGQVTDANAQAVCGAAIYTTWDQAKCENQVPARVQNQQAGLTADDGSFRFTFTVKLLKSVTELVVSFFAAHDDHLRSDAKAFTLARDGQVDDLKLVLAAGGTISGRIAGPDGRRLENAIVVATTHSRPTERKEQQIVRKAPTDAAGSYIIKGLPTDTYVVSVECAGYKAVKLDQTAVKAGETKLGVDATLAITTAIRGKIEVRQMSDFRTGHCSFYEGECCVKVCSLVVHDDKTFTVVDPPAGSWEIEISWWRYRSVNRTAVTVTEDQHIDVGTIEVEEVVEDLPHD